MLTSQHTKIKVTPGLSNNKLMDSEKSQKEESMEAWLEVLIGTVLGLVVGAGSTYIFMVRSPKKPPMSYKDFKETFHDSMSDNLIMGTLREMYRGDKPYPRWKDIAKVYLARKADIPPIQSYILWTLAVKYKKQREVLKVYPACEKTARGVERGVPFSKAEPRN